jgi:hypothetical protein
MTRRTDEPGSNVRVDNWLDAVEQMDMGPLNHLTCTEVTALADLMHFYRGETKATWVIIHHVTDGDDEEPDELREHLAEWPALAAALRRVVSEDTDIIELLNEVEEEDRDSQE